MLEVTGALFGDDDIERHVVRFARDVLELLRGKGDADEARTPGEPFQRTVVVAAAVAEARSALVEAKERHQDDIGFDLGGEFGWGQRTETGLVERRALFPEPQFQRL